MKFIWRIITIVFLLLPLSTQAVIVKSLYSTTVPVANQSAELRQRAITEAFANVLVKVSGNSAVTSVSKVRQQLSTAAANVQEYSYQQAKGSIANERSLILKVKFDPKAVKAVLSAAGQAVWGDNRPLVLVWIALSHKGQQYLISDSTDNSGFYELFESDSARRGIPILFPLLDLEEMQNVSFQQIWSLDPAEIRRAAQRYASNAILAGRVNQRQDGSWHAQWLFLLRTSQMSWQTSGTDLQQIIKPIVANMADVLAVRFASLLNQQNNNKIDLKIVGINNASAYAKALRYLQALPPVAKLEILSLAPNEVHVRLQVDGGVQALRQVINLGHTMKAITQNQEQQQFVYAIPQLYYRYLN